GAQFDAERRKPQSEEQRPQREQRSIPQSILLQLRQDIGQMTPFLRSDRQPFDACTVEEQQGGGGNEPETQPNGPPVFLGEQFAPRRCAPNIWRLCRIGKCHEELLAQPEGATLTDFSDGVS